MKKFPFLFFILLMFQFWFVQNVSSEEIPSRDEISKEAFSNVADEFATCGAYFGIMSETLRNSNDIDTADSYEKLRDNAIGYAFLVLQEGRSKEMTEKLVKAKIEVNLKEMTKEVNTDFSNIAILIDEHAERCKEAMENPKKIINEWNDKTLKKYGLEQ